MFNPEFLSCLRKMLMHQGEMRFQTFNVVKSAFKGAFFRT